MESVTASVGWSFDICQREGLPHARVGADGHQREDSGLCYACRLGSSAERLREFEGLRPGKFRSKMSRFGHLTQVVLSI
jgi:hypothetical protein